MSFGPRGPAPLCECPESASSSPEFAKRAIEEAGRLFPGRRVIIANVFPSGADSVAAAAIGVPLGVLGEAAERLYEASRQAADERASEGGRLAKEAG